MASACDQFGEPKNNKNGGFFSMGEIVYLAAKSQPLEQQQINITFGEEWALIDACVPLAVAEEFLRLCQQKKEEQEAAHA